MTMELGGSGGRVHCVCARTKRPTHKSDHDDGRRLVRTHNRKNDLFQSLLENETDYDERSEKG